MDAKKKTFAKPVDWDELYPGRFLHAADLKGKKVTVRISDVSLEELVGDKGPQVKGLMSFEGKDKQFALNKTNGILIKAMFGRKLADWVGKRITLFEDTWDGEPCLRVWGSPDIKEDIEVTVALPRKRPFNRTLRKMNAPTPVQQSSPPPSVAGGDEPPDEYFREPGSDDE
jgi:hypothetical protein